MGRERARRTQPRADVSSIAGSPRDLEILGDLAWAGFLTTDQLMRLHFPSRRRAQRRLRALLDLGLVRASMQGEALHRPNVYTLTSAGLDLLAENQRFAPSALPRLARLPRPQKRRHAIAIREVFVAFRRAEMAHSLALEDFLFEEQLVRVEPFAAHSLIPDAVVTFRASEHATLGIEVDLGTETTTILRAKLVRWRELIAHGGALAILLAAEREKRADTMRRIVGDVGLDGVATVVSLAELDAYVGGRRWTRSPGAIPGRAARPGCGGEDRAMTGVLRARGRGV